MNGLYFRRKKDQFILIENNVKKNKINVKMYMKIIFIDIGWICLVRFFVLVLWYKVIGGRLFLRGVMNNCNFIVEEFLYSEYVN